LSASGEFISIARIVRPQGRRGEVAAELHTDFPQRFAERRNLFLLMPDGSRRSAELEAHWLHKGRVILKFAGVDNIEAAQALAGSEVQIPREQRVQLEAGSAYISELVGCRVRDARSGRELGEIAEVVFGAGEAPLLVLHAGAKELSVPFAQEFLQRMDLVGKRIEVSLPEGMTDLDAPLSEEEKAQQRSAKGKR
jgi:16S rRNA processing protein RimM